MERQNLSYDKSFGRHTCNLSLKKYNSLDVGNEDPEEIFTVVNQSQLKQTVDSRRQQFRKSAKLIILKSDEEKYLSSSSLSREESYSRTKLCLDSKNRSCDSNFGRHTCGLSMDSPKKISRKKNQSVS